MSFYVRYLQASARLMRSFKVSGLRDLGGFGVLKCGSSSGVLQHMNASIRVLFVTYFMDFPFLFDEVSGVSIINKRFGPS